MCIDEIKRCLRSPSGTLLILLIDHPANPRYYHPRNSWKVCGDLLQWPRRVGSLHVEHFHYFEDFQKEFQDVKRFKTFKLCSKDLAPPSTIGSRFRGQCASGRVGLAWARSHRSGYSDRTAWVVRVTKTKYSCFNVLHKLVPQTGSTF